jgi:outer membrane lipoprotein-sorting protein
MNPIQYRYLPIRRRDWLMGATLLCSVPLHAAPDAQAILAASDAIRNPSRPFSVTVTLTEFQGGSEVNASTLQSYSRVLAKGGQFASILRYVKPARDSGKLMLKVGSDLWFFDPATKASVRISPQQRLAGQASNGDVVTVNFARDYTATIAGTEEITDGERRKRRSLKLGLTAASEEAVYASAELWVDAESNQPLKARFYADSGRALKTAYYRRYQSQLGAERPTEMVIIDGLDPQAVTVLRMSEYAAREIPVTWYSRDFLPRFQPE